MTCSSTPWRSCPPSQKLALPGSGPAAPGLDRLATAYGIRDQVMIGAEADGVSGDPGRRPRPSTAAPNWPSSSPGWTVTSLPARRARRRRTPPGQADRARHQPPHPLPGAAVQPDERAAGARGRHRCTCSSPPLMPAANPGCARGRSSSSTPTCTAAGCPGPGTPPSTSNRCCAALTRTSFSWAGSRRWSRAEWRCTPGRGGGHSEFGAARSPGPRPPAAGCDSASASGSCARRRSGSPTGLPPPSTSVQLVPGLPVVIGRNTTPVRSSRAVTTTERWSRSSPSGQAIPRKGLDVIVDAFAIAGRSSLPPDRGRRRLRARGARGASQWRQRALPRRGAVGPDQGRLQRGRRIPVSDPLGRVRAGPGRGDGVRPSHGGLGRAGAITDLAVPDRNCVVVSDNDPASWAQAVRIPGGGRWTPSESMGARRRARSSTGGRSIMPLTP